VVQVEVERLVISSYVEASCGMTSSNLDWTAGSIGTGADQSSCWVLASLRSACAWIMDTPVNLSRKLGNLYSIVSSEWR